MGGNHIVHGPLNDSPAGGIDGAAESAPRRASFLRVLQAMAMTVVVLDTFPETRWLAGVVGVSSPSKSGPSR
jgi:hypothetical protein